MPVARAESQAVALTVLVVDDEPLVGELLRELLAADGYKVSVAHDGSECLALAGAHPPDLVLLDLAMPGMDGLTTLRKLRERGFDAVALVLTGHGSLESVREAMVLGVFEYLTKPVDVGVLSRVLREGSAWGRTVRSAGAGGLEVHPDRS